METKENSALLHTTSSSQKRERCIMAIEQSLKNSKAKSLSLTASMAFSHSLEKCSWSARYSRSVS